MESEIAPAISSEQRMGQAGAQTASGGEGFHLNGLVHKLKSGELALGAWVQVGDYVGARAIGDSTADFAILDMEHHGFSFPDLGLTLQWMLNRRTAAAVPAVATPIVRIPPNGAELNQWVAKQTLDYGPFGILAPHVTHRAQIESAVSSMRYPSGPSDSGPAGVRGALPMHAMRYWGVTDISDYFDRADLWPLNPSGDLMLTVLVESVTAWENIDELVSVPGLGAIIWGPGDGSMALGIRNYDIGDPRLTPYREKVIAACKSAGVAVGSPAAVDPFAAIDEGFDFLMLPHWDEDLAARLRRHTESR